MLSCSIESDDLPELLLSGDFFADLWNRSSPDFLLERFSLLLDGLLELFSMSGGDLLGRLPDNLLVLLSTLVVFKASNGSIVLEDCIGGVALPGL